MDEAAAPFASPLNQLAAATAAVSVLSLSSADESKSAEPAAVSVPVSDDNPDTDSDAQPRPRKRKKTGKYHTPLTDQQRIDIVRLHIDEGKTATTIVRLYHDRGIDVPLGTVYTLIRKQAHNLPLGRQRKRNRPAKYSEEDQQLVVQAQLDDNRLRYDQLKNVWKDAHPEAAHPPSNGTIRKWLKAADITSKLLIPVPKARNTPANIEARKEYSTRALRWDRDALVFIDETSFDRNLHQHRGRSKKGTPATFTALNTPGPGIKVCAAVSPVMGLVMWEPQLTAWNGDDFARFMTRLCRKPGVDHRSMTFIMDNVRVHHTQVVKDALAAQRLECKVEYLPTYSPHLNPIEYCFHNWKTEIKHIDQVKDQRTLQQQVDDTRTCITAHLVDRITDHVYQLHIHCQEGLPLEDFKPIGHRVLRAAQEAERQRQELVEDEKKE